MTKVLLENFPKSLANESYIGAYFGSKMTLPGSFLAERKCGELTDLLSYEAGFKLVFNKVQLNNFRLMEDLGLILAVPLKLWVCFSTAFFSLLVLVCLSLTASSRCLRAESDLWLKFRDTIP